MSATKEIKALLALFGKKQSDLMGLLQMGSKQSLSNKFTNERWSASDLVSIAEYCGCQLAFVLPDGGLLPISPGEDKEKSPDA